VPDRFRWGVWSWLSFIIVIIGVLAWVLTFAEIDLAEDSPAWILTIFVNPVGVVLGIVAIIKEQRFALVWTILNLLLTVSLFPMWFFGTLLFGP
jgi:FtsH-binding integral membrane protein